MTTTPIAVPTVAAGGSFSSAQTTRPHAAHRALQRTLVSLGFVGGGAAMLTLGGTATLAHILTRPRHLRAIPAQQIDETIEEITFLSEDGLRLCGWYLPHSAPRDVIVICHGFAMNRHELLDIARSLRVRGHAVLLFDFRGHGTSDGARTTIGYHEAGDIIAAIGYLQARPELAGLPLGVAGISMGGAATLLAAAREPRIAAIAADSSFAALSETAAGSLRQLSRWLRYPVGPLIIRFGELLTRVKIGINRPIDAIATLAPRPVLLIHDTEDTFIPVRNAYALYEAATGPKELWVRRGRGHASLWALCPDEYVERLDSFFSRALGTDTAVAA